MKILAKFPTRGRPARFLSTLREWANSAAKPEDVTFLVSYDYDDPSMTPGVLEGTKGLPCDVRLYGGSSKNKIEAVNADISRIGGWDVVLVVSDDMFCRRSGWDSMIREQMDRFHPDGDGALWFHDGSKQREICTLSCMTFKFYNRFGYIYHPSYKSFFCDNEYTDVARGLGKLPFIEQPICTHEHPAWGGGMKVDALYQRNNKFWAEDERNYLTRKAAGFPA